MQHTLTFDMTTGHTVKPKNEEMGKINFNLNTIKSVTIDSFCKAMTLGYTFSPSIFTGKRCNLNWKSQSLFCLDFDSGITPDEVIERLEELSLEPNVIYSSFSDSPLKRKFRVCFFLDTVIIDANEANYIQLGLMALFSKTIDHSTSDRARLFFGGKEILYKSNNETSLEQLLLVLDSLEVVIETKVSKYINKYESIESSINNNPTDLDKARFALGATKKKVGFCTKGNIHFFALRYGGMCNMLGLDIYSALQYANQEGSIVTKHFEDTVEDVYKRYSYQHNTMKFTVNY